MRYIAYFRKSTEQAERQSLSIPAQKRKIGELFPDIKITHCLEESMSAFKPGRPVFDQMLQLLEDGEADGIVSWHPDRLSRNEVDAAKITYGLRRGIIKDLKFGSSFFDNSPEGIMMLQNTMSHSQYYSSKLSKDVKRGMDEQRKRGWLTGRAIEGYLNERNKEGMSYGIIVEDPERFPLIRKMWDLMLTGNYSVPMICDIANNQWGYLNRGTRKFDSRPIAKNTLYYILRNPRYAGLIPVPGKVGEFEKASYKAMVTEEEFNRVQKLLGNKGYPKLKTKKYFPYRGIIACGECGCLMTPEKKTRYYKNGSTQSFTYYHCTHQRPCSQRKNVREETIEKQFTELLDRITILPEFKDWALEVLDEQSELETNEANAVLKSQNRAIESTHKEMKGLISMASKELISEDQFKSQKQELEEKLSALNEELNDTQNRANNWYETFTRVFELALHGKERFETGDVSTKREILADIGQNPVLIDGELKIDTYPWVQVIKNNYKELEEEYLDIRTRPQQVWEPAIAGIKSKWLGR